MKIKIRIWEPEGAKTRIRVLAPLDRTVRVKVDGVQVLEVGPQKA